ncbi:NUDIX hydrolase [Thalassoglobus polymorphus]|uniref:GDP-mannose pyrophosphatase n=1 Tax=Thalassoglobus polymorphus TaxID=2527994 RepID=A0A517QRJ3_9PLAN|nr:NUDIX hydrolase [Thalassoglobus polymorphus]QDT34247.1 ADP-ribose pyrophosphatase [Thalassoglobus polymorphus]
MAKREIETLYQGKHLQLQKRRHWEFASRTQGTGVVAIVAVTTDQQLVLTEQFRPPIQKKVVDLPAGLAGDIAGEEQESFESAARRELIEETGFVGETFEYIFSGPSSAGMTTEMIDFYLACDVEQVEEGGGDETEDIKVHVIPMKKIKAWLKRKETSKTCIDPKVYAALGILSLYTS